MWQGWGAALGVGLTSNGIPGKEFNRLFRGMLYVVVTKQTEIVWYSHRSLHTFLLPPLTSFNNPFLPHHILYHISYHIISYRRFATTDWGDVLAQRNVTVPWTPPASHVPPGSDDPSQVRLGDVEKKRRGEEEKKKRRRRGEEEEKRRRDVHICVCGVMCAVWREEKDIHTVSVVCCVLCVMCSMLCAIC